MQKAFLRFLANTAILSAIILIAGIFLFLYPFREQYIFILPYVLVFFYIITCGLHYVLLRITRLKPDKFVTYFMMITTIKLLFYMIVMIVYLFFDREGAVVFLLVFLFLYILFTVFEVLSLLSFLKKI
ncbi:MAG: hypothetical protein KJ607_03070 [Bacteroidetes bacterium]|nr:hypothetical protein [Bacteroidota bacterium]